MKKYTIGVLAIFITILMLVSAMPGTISSRSVDPNLVAYWKFNEGTGITAYDETTNANDGTLGGDGVGTDLPTWTTGIEGDALEFDGTDDNVKVTDSSTLDLTTKISVEAWIKLDTIPVNEKHIVNKWMGGSYGGWYRTGYGLLLGNQWSGKTELFVILGFGSSQFGGFYTNNLDGTWKTTCTWHHIAFTYDNSLPAYNLKIYKDGVLAAQFTETRAIATNNLDLYLGRNNPNDVTSFPFPFFDGKLDEVAIWDKALSSTEIKAHYDEYPATGAAVDIDPNTLNLKSKGKWITGYIDLSAGCGNANMINVNTVKLNNTIPAAWGEVQNNIQMVKFDRSDVEDLISAPNDTVNLIITGQLSDGTTFGGNDTIRAIRPGK